MRKNLRCCLMWMIELSGIVLSFCKLLNRSPFSAFLVPYSTGLPFLFLFFVWEENLGVPGMSGKLVGLDVTLSFLLFGMVLFWTLLLLLFYYLLCGNAYFLLWCLWSKLLNAPLMFILWGWISSVPGSPLWKWLLQLPWKAVSQPLPEWNQW